MKSTGQRIFLRVVSVGFVLGALGASASPQIARHTSAASGASDFGLTKKHDDGAPRPAAGAGTGVPVAARPGISAALGRDDSRYRVRAVGDGFRAENPQQALTAEFTAQGIEVRSGAAQWGLALRGYGYADALQPASPAAPHASANRVEYRRGRLTEWYVNGPLGMEQGFTLAARPAENSGQPLTIALDLSKELSASVDPGGQGVTLTQDGGQAGLRYAGLAAYDATGKELRSWMEARGNDLLLLVEDAGARYPLVVDPFIQLAKLTASDGAAFDDFGFSVTLSADGSTLAVGACRCDLSSGPGAAYVFVKPTSGWATTSTFAAKLTASDGVTGDGFGVSVAMSSDGNTLVVGAFQFTLLGAVGPGAAYVFLKPTSGWATMTETTKLTASDGAVSSEFGRSVAISGDGGTVAVGAPLANIGQGAAYVFVKPASGWATMTETAKLTASDGVANDDLGFSVSISSDGGTVAAGEIQGGRGPLPGAAYVFVEPAGGWATTSTFTAKLTASDGAAFDEFGASVAISGDGSTLAVGAPSNNLNQGAAYVFVKPAGGWATTSTFTAKLTAADGAASEAFGGSLATSSDGSVIVSGSLLQKLHSSSVQGVVHVFLKPTSGWATASNVGSKLPAYGVQFVFVAIFVAISDDGSTAVVAAPFAQVGSNSNQGIAFLLGEHQRPR